MNALEFRFAFYARDFEQSIHFYRDQLGMKPVGQWWDRSAGKGALLSTGGTGVIEIYGAPQGQVYAGPAPTALNLALRLENRAALDDFYNRLLKDGVQRIEEPQDRTWGHRSFIVYDPDNIPVHIYGELNS